MIGVNYFRLNPILHLEVELNEKDDRLLLSMIIDARRFILKHMDELKEATNILLGGEN